MRQRLSEQIKKQDPTDAAYKKIHFKYKNTNRLKVNDRENYISTLTLLKRNLEHLY